VTVSLHDVIFTDNCLTRPALCDRNAVCSRTSAGDFVCICNPGYRGDGSTCSRKSTTAVCTKKVLIITRPSKP